MSEFKITIQACDPLCGDKPNVDVLTKEFEIGASGVETAVGLAMRMCHRFHSTWYKTVDAWAESSGKAGFLITSEKIPS